MVVLLTTEARTVAAKFGHEVSSSGWLAGSLYY